MQFKFFTIALAAFSFGLTAVTASPVAAVAAVEKRDVNSDVNSVLQGLQGKTNTILPQITALTQGGLVTELAITPLLNDLKSAIDTATADLSKIPHTTSASKRQSNEQIAQLVASIITDITHALDNLVGDLATIPILGGLLNGIDASLSQLLHGLEGLLAGLLNLVATLLVDVAALLRQLAFALTLGSLGL
jgi:hypothetical protein